MKSIAIKDNNLDILNFINDRFLKLDLKDITIHSREFNSYSNIIIHFLGKDNKLFYDRLSSILTDTIIKFYQRKLIKRILEYNYFYFNTAERKQIIDIAEDFIESDLISFDDNYFAIYYSVLDYISCNKSLVLEGFVNFRLSNYIKNLDYITDIAVNKYITDKEYLEFVNMLKMYVAVTPSKANLVHLVYLGNESILLDSEKNIIPMDDQNLNAKYLSDISFSSNDYALNTLLNLIPRKLIIHLMDGKSDEFINTLKLIFENKYEICSSCELCRLYKINFN